METRNSLVIAAVLLVILGIIMIYLGSLSGPKLLLPPVITGVGFFVIAWAFIKMRK
ncbi:MAG: hypothetical protein ABI472_25170 [Ginsengibacter sp.]